MTPNPRFIPGMYNVLSNAKSARNEKYVEYDLNKNLIKLTQIPNHSCFGGQRVMETDEKWGKFKHKNGSRTEIINIYRGVGVGEGGGGGGG